MSVRLTLELLKIQNLKTVSLANRQAALSIEHLSHLCILCKIKPILVLVVRQCSISCICTLFWRSIKLMFCHHRVVFFSFFLIYRSIMPEICFCYDVVVFIFLFTTTESYFWHMYITLYYIRIACLKKKQGELLNKNAPSLAKYFHRKGFSLLHYFNNIPILFFMLSDMMSVPTGKYFSATCRASRPQSSSSDVANVGHRRDKKGDRTLSFLWASDTNEHCPIHSTIIHHVNQTRGHSVGGRLYRLHSL